MHTITASIDTANEGSLKLQKFFVFEDVVHFKQVGYKFGRWLDFKFLELILKTPVNPLEGQNEWLNSSKSPLLKNYFPTKFLLIRISLSFDM